ncbi:hypothetical protein [Rhodopirellula sp. P2]|uniref:hypothetical protein n=1 Tax=Rhodopirellula sp. P2 TaxID=2127060 RepID=UPI002368CD33|nr:hypothetical protein [Rhodopirellula sp. P2]WDQ17394.1 hypothetical protein PSR62_02290 [Rhodopirellula sp. P2]
MSSWPAATVRYVLVGYALIPLVINVGVNALLGWLLFSGQTSIPVWGASQSVLMEIIGTGFLLPLITAMISSRVLLRHLHSGMVKPLPALAVATGAFSRLVRWVGRTLRAGSLNGCLLFSLAVFPLLTIPAVLALFALDGDSMALPTLVAMKSIYAGLCGLVVTPLIAISLLGGSRKPWLE